MNLPASLKRLLDPHGRHRADDRIGALTVERDAARAANQILLQRLAAADELIARQYHQLVDIRLDNSVLRLTHRELSDAAASLQYQLDAARADTIEIPIFAVLHAPPAGPRTWEATEAPTLTLIGGGR
jgi:hypothetical protein